MVVGSQEPPGRDLIVSAIAGGRTALDEAEAKELFDAYGIPVVPGGLAGTADEAAAIAARVGYPVVMKGSSSEILHKSDVGLVLLDITDEQTVRSCYGELVKRGRRSPRRRARRAHDPRRS